MSRLPALNRRVKRVPGWVLLTVVVAGLLAAGAVGGHRPRSQVERVAVITKQLRCPVCAGESVYESHTSAAQNIRDEVARQVAAGVADAQIKASIERSFPDTVLVPPASGVNTVLWVLPVMVIVAAGGALLAVFRRWKAEAAGARAPTDADRALVAAALADGRGAAGDANSARSPGDAGDSMPPAARAGRTG